MKNIAAIILSSLILLTAASCGTKSNTLPVLNLVPAESEAPAEANESSSDMTDTESSLISDTSTESEALPEPSAKESSIAKQSEPERYDVQASDTERPVEASKTESSASEPSKAESSASEPSEAESSASEPSKAESSASEPSKAESSASEPSKAESSASEPSNEKSSVSEASKPEASAAPEKPATAQQPQTAKPEEADADIPVIKRTRSKVDRIEIEWKPVEGADGYIIHYSTAKSLAPKKCKKIETAGSKITLTGLAINKKYYFHVCSYKKESSGQKTCSDWSRKHSEYLKTIHVIDGVTYVDGILIANKTYSLPADFGDGLDPETYDAFNRMARDAANDGIYLYIISDFRSYQTQNYTYNSFVYDRGVEQADRCSARPGHSEHQTGLAIDVNTTSDYFDGTPEAIWLARNCVRYGFIIRYPKGKEAVTGYKYEPWHIRYLGTQKAAEIANSGLTIEEYYGITSVYQ